MNHPSSSAAGTSGRLSAWDDPRATCLGLGPGPLDRTGKGVNHR